jgi:hypothetical protein
MFADNVTRTCVYNCPYTASAISYADSYKSKRCVAVCPDKYFGDFSTGTGICVSYCAGAGRFRDNLTQTCVSSCPAATGTYPSTYGDNSTNMCVKTCPAGTFAQV